MLLYINTSQFESVEFALIHNSSAKTFQKVLAYNENYKTNQLLDGFLKRESVTVKQLEKIVVCSGPGSFTGIRVGVALAQALGFALNIPVFTIAGEELPADLAKLDDLTLESGLNLHYGAEPNITLKI